MGPPQPSPAVTGAEIRSNAAVMARRSEGRTEGGETCPNSEMPKIDEEVIRVFESLTRIDVRQTSSVASEDISPVNRYSSQSFSRQNPAARSGRRARDASALGSGRPGLRVNKRKFPHTAKARWPTPVRGAVRYLPLRPSSQPVEIRPGMLYLTRLSSSSVAVGGNSDGQKDPNSGISNEDEIPYAFADIIPEQHPCPPYPTCPKVRGGGFSGLSGLFSRLPEIVGDGPLSLNCPAQRRL